VIRAGPLPARRRPVGSAAVGGLVNRFQSDPPPGLAPIDVGQRGVAGDGEDFRLFFKDMTR
jgi:hypothetical protein